MRVPRLRFTIRTLMVAVAFVAVYCSQWAYLQRWKSRRAVMYQQRDITRSIILEVKQDIAAAGRTASEIRNESDRVTYTTHWTERLEAWETRDGRRQLLMRATVSGDNGRFSLPPILVETYGSPLDDLWLDRLLRAYREKGWRCKVVQAPAGPDPAAP
jgi:hypothetical protein